MMETRNLLVSKYVRGLRVGFFDEVHLMVMALCPYQPLHSGSGQFARREWSVLGALARAGNWSSFSLQMIMRWSKRLATGSATSSHRPKELTGQDIDYRLV